MKRRAPINIFKYRNYRQFLRDWYSKAKESRSSFSFRLFSKRAGFKSTNFLKLVMDGDRNLSEESLQKFIDGLKLNKQEREFFRNLVFFNQARTHTERDFYYKKMLQSRKYSQLKPIEKEQYEYCSTWYHAVIRELIIFEDCDGTPEWLAAHITPPISVDQAAKSLQLLQELGFIEKDKPGKWKQSDVLLSTGPEVDSVVLMNYHLNLLDLTKDILVNVSSSRRDVSAMTLGIKKDLLPDLKKRIQEFRQEILKMSSLDMPPEDVVQVNIQMYPMTRNDEDNVE